MKAAGVLALVGLTSTSGSAAQVNRRQRGRQPDDTLQRHNFTVELDDEELDATLSVSLPKSRTEQDEYREGDDPETARKVWGGTSFDDLEMERGVKPGDTKLHDWYEAVREGRVEKGRKKLAVVLRDRRGQPHIRWELEGAWINKYEPPELDASADGEVATESVTVAFDKMIRTEA